jgi:hypothetical protein
VTYSRVLSDPQPTENNSLSHSIQGQELLPMLDVWECPETFLEVNDILIQFSSPVSTGPNESLGLGTSGTMLPRMSVHHPTGRCTFALC